MRTKISVFLLVLEFTVSKSRNPLYKRLSRHFSVFVCTTFAWFTSKDEVTNRLSANADYGVSIVESFAPPENWIPGQTINKDVYAVNTGSIGAFVKETVTSKFSITKEVPVTVTQNQTADPKNNGTIASMQYTTAGDTEITDCIELDYDEVYVTEAGAYLAYVPNGSTQEPGRLIVAYDADYDPETPTYKYVATDSGTTYYMTATEYANATANTPSWPAGIPDTLKSGDKWSKVEAPASKTDFTPDSEGLYVFRRVINVDSRNGETFEYEAYYYRDGHYYKVKNLAVTPDNVQDFSNDQIYTDGIIDSATFDLVKEVKEVVVPTLTYDQANNRLVATYGTFADNAQNTIIGTNNATDLAKLAEDLDKAEHAWVEARAALDRALSEKATSDSNVAKDQAAIAALEAELASVNARISELTALIGNDSNGLTKRVSDQNTLANTTDKNDLESKLETLYGTAHKTDYNYSLDGDDANDKITYVENASDTSTTTGVDGKYKAYLKAKEDYEAAKTAYGADAYTAYLADLRAKFGGSGGKLENLPADATLDDAIALLTYDDLKDVPYNGTDGKHLLNQKAVALLKAELEYNQAKTAAQDAYNKYKSDMILLGNGKVNSGTAATTETVGGYNIDYTEYVSTYDSTQTPSTNSDTYVSGMRKELADLQAEKDTLTSKKTALNTALDTAYNQAVADATFPGSTSGTAAANLTTATDAYNSAYNAYIAAQNAYNKRKAEYDAAKNLKIYINLKDVVTAGGIKDKWQIVPVDTENLNNETDNKDTASFYYTSILPSGETSAMLIDSVKLADEVTQDMYKSFDFDIDVKLDSRQVAYKEGDPTELETAQLADFGANVTFDDKHDEGTALTWVAP